MAMCFLLRIYIYAKIRLFPTCRLWVSCFRWISWSEWEHTYTSFQNVLFHVHHVIHLALVAHVCVTHLTGSIVYVHYLSFSLVLTTVGIGFDELFTKGAKFLLGNIDLFNRLGLQISLGFLELSCVLCVGDGILSHDLRNHLMILSNCRKVLPMQYPNSDISTKSQLSLISACNPKYPVWIFRRSSASSLWWIVSRCASISCASPCWTRSPIFGECPVPPQRRTWGIGRMRWIWPIMSGGWTSRIAFLTLFIE